MKRSGKRAVKPRRSSGKPAAPLRYHKSRNQIISGRKRVPKDKRS